MAVRITIILFLVTASIGLGSGQVQSMVWPPSPDKPRVEYVGEIRCADLTAKAGLFGRIKRLIGGRSSEDALSLPFDVLAKDGYLYLTCQNLPALVRIDPKENAFIVLKCEEIPFIYPIALCDGGDNTVYITDSESRTVYRLYNDMVEPFIKDGLNRPTGIACNAKLGRLYVVDTGDHSLKIYDLKGRFIAQVDGRGKNESAFNFPTFARAASDNSVIVNDALNYRIKLLDGDGRLLTAFGQEGDGPGAFSRPKGIAIDSPGHIYVVDNLFDNVQVFDHDGRILLVIGSAGQEPGRFWSPAGIDIVGDTIYIADTFNNRIQILRYLGGSDD